MISKSHTSAMNSAAAIFAALFAVSGLLWDPFRDDVTDDLIPPWCRAGSPQSWEGKPCAIPDGGAAAKAASGGR